MTTTTTATRRKLKIKNFLNQQIEEDAKNSNLTRSNIINEIVNINLPSKETLTNALKKTDIETSDFLITLTPNIKERLKLYSKLTGINQQDIIFLSLLSDYFDLQLWLL